MRCNTQRKAKSLDMRREVGGAIYGHPITEVELMRPDQIDWDSGEVVFWGLGFLVPLKPLADQIDDLKEDLAQVRYAGDVVLDIGWYPEFSEEGEFVVRVVRESHWDEPLFLEAHKTVDGLLKCLKEAILAAKNNRLSPTR